MSIPNLDEIYVGAGPWKPRWTMKRMARVVWKAIVIFIWSFVVTAGIIYIDHKVSKPASTTYIDPSYSKVLGDQSAQNTLRQVFAGQYIRIEQLTGRFNGNLVQAGDPGSWIAEVFVKGDQNFFFYGKGRTKEEAAIECLLDAASTMNWYGLKQHSKELENIHYIEQCEKDKLDGSTSSGFDCQQVYVFRNMENYNVATPGDYNIQAPVR